MIKKFVLLTFLAIQLTNVVDARTKYKHDNLFDQVQFSSGSNYMSYTGIIRFGLFEASHNWVDRKDVDHYFDILEYARDHNMRVFN